MRTMSYRKFFTGLIVFLLSGVGNLYAAETPASNNTDIALAAEPARYSFIEGDASKFRALHWMDDGFAMGVNDFTLKTELKDNVTIESEGHAVPEDGDYSGLVHITKENVGYVNFDYSSFRKYYGNGGGFYRPFNNLNQVYTDKELALNIGKFGIEAGLTMKNIPDIVLNYEREFKEGTKSRLTWALVSDNVGSVKTQRKTAPSWQQLDEITDSFRVRMSDTTLGFNWKADQRWEYTRENNLREEKQITDVSALTSSDAKIRDQFQQPRTNIITTILGLNRWFMKDKVYASSDYRFSQVDARELESVVETDGTGALHNFSFPHQYKDAYADNHYVSQTGVASFMTTLMNPLSVITAFKAESIHRRGESTIPNDDGGGGLAPAQPDGLVDSYEVANNQQKIMNYGESVSLRYGGIPRVALYNDYEFSQTRNNLYESYTTAGSDFIRQTLSHQYRGSGTLGAQFVPWNKVTLTIQGRYRRDDLRYKVPIAIDDAMIYIDDQTVDTNEVETRLMWRPCRYFQPAFRYQLMNKKFQTVQHFPKPNSDPIETGQTSSVYTWDLTSQPVDDLLLTASFSFTDGKVTTPTRYATTGPAIPTFDFDSYSTLFSAEYSFNENLTLTGTADYTRAANFNDFGSIGLPYGADFHQADLVVGLRWAPKKDLTIEPKYAWYQYRANQAEVGSYNANMVSLEVKSKW